jgi:hypothetical protein
LGGGVDEMAMKIEEVIEGKSDHESVSVDGLIVPVDALRKLHKEGYTNLNFYKGNNTFSFWGKNCTACFTLEQLRERAKSK